MLVTAQFSATMARISLISPPELREGDNFFFSVHEMTSVLYWVNPQNAYESHFDLMRKLCRFTWSTWIIWEEKNTQQARHPRHNPQDIWADFGLGPEAAGDSTVQWFKGVAYMIMKFS